MHGVAAIQGGVPIIIHTIQGMILKDSVDREFQELQPAGLEAHLDAKFAPLAIVVVSEVSLIVFSGPFVAVLFE
jgi:hypothetical protein